MARVLLVHADTDIREITTLRLQLDGHHVFPAGDAATAVTLAGAGTKFDVAVLDVDVPGAGGDDLLDSLRAVEAFREVPVVLFASYEANAVSVRGLSLGAVTRGQPLARLLSTITSLLRPISTPTC